MAASAYVAAILWAGWVKRGIDAEAKGKRITNA
jgi:hypothetical protein